MSGSERTWRYWATGLLALVLLAVSAPGQAREVVVGLYENDPKIFRDASGQPAGIFVDLIKEIAADEGWELTWTDCAWADCLSRTAAGEIDLMPDVALTESRRQRLDFHERPALHSWSQMYRRPGSPIESLLDLEGRTVAVLDGSVQQAALEVLLEEMGIDHELLLVSEMPETMVAVTDGRADVAAVNHLFGGRYHQEYGLSRTPIIFQPSRLFIATGNGRNVALLDAIDAHLARWRADDGSVYYDVLERWLGDRSRFQLPAWVTWAAGGAGVALLFVSLLALWLRHLVRLRGRRLDEAGRALKTAYHVIDASPVVLFRWRLEPGWPVEYVSENVRRWGYDAAQLVRERTPVAELIHPDDRLRLEARLAERLESPDESRREQFRLRKSDGTFFWVETVSRLLRDASGRPGFMEGVVADVTERRESERRQREAAAVIDNTLEGMIVTDMDGRIVMVNPAFGSLTGYDESDVLGRPVSMLDAEPGANPWADIHQDLKDRGHWQGELSSRRRDGEIFPEVRSINRVAGLAGEADHIVHLFTDMSRIKATEARLDFLAQHDALTGLPNRSLLLSQLNQRIRGDSKRRIGLLLVDLDRFRDVNDSYGHHVGDELLRQVSSRLDALLGDACLARLGGDEFAVLIDDVESEMELARLAEQLIDALNEPWQLEGHAEIRLGASVGITIHPDFGRLPEVLLQQADAAVYRAKTEGRGGFRFFDESLTASARQRIEMESRLRRAIVNDELELHYQPQVDSRDGRIIGGEALVRWRDRERGLISPGEFIPVAEQTGMIGAVGDWVLREACRQGRAWLDAGIRPGRLAVNLSAQQLRDVELIERIVAILEETGFPAEWLELELTESALMRQQDEVVERLRELKRLGVHLAIDDFGTGYSSLAYLQRFPVDVLKIDKRFVDNLADNADDREIATAILAMGHALGLSVLAEGVETREQLDFLQNRQCDAWQGYLCSRPVPADAFAVLLRENDGV